MKLMIVGTGVMGKTLAKYAEEEGSFDEIVSVEPQEEAPYEEYEGDVAKPDLIIDFSHPQAIYGIYEFCRKQGGNIPVVLAATGYGREEEEIIHLLEKICPVDRRSNYSQGIAAMTEMVKLGKSLLAANADIRVFEAHHTKKKDAPSGTAKSLCEVLEIPPEEYGEKIACLRMGTVFGEHSVYFAMEDEVVEIRHTAFSKKIFAVGALEAGKKMLSCKNRDLGV